MTNRLAILLILVGTTGCSIDLVDGAYACSRGSCPSGWYCHEDDRCRRTPEDDSGTTTLRDAADATPGIDAGDLVDSGVDAFVPSDGGTGAAIYEVCTQWSDCGEFMCAKGPDSSTTLGQCSRTCAMDSDCPTVGGATGTCIGGSCLRACATTTDCPGAFGCYMDPTSAKHACFQVQSTAWQGNTACGTLQATCANPSQCVSNGLLDLSGICVVPCSGPADDCPWNADCRAMPAGANGPPFGCVARCATGTDCLAGATCTTFGAPEKHCSPSGWGN